MGNHVTEWLDTLPCSFKVHSTMCTKLKKFVDRLMKIFPDMEAARPRCSSGLEALCLLSDALERAKNILQRCSESSKLYLAITGDAVLSRCQRVKNLLEKSLSRIQSMVPVKLALEIFQIIEDLRAVMFVLEPSEEEAGKVVREMMHQTASASVALEDSEFKALQFAAMKLQITNPKAIMIEKRSLKRLLVETGDRDPHKKKILRLLLYLLGKYGNRITKERQESSCPQHEASYAGRNSSCSSVCTRLVETELCDGHMQTKTEVDAIGRAIPPEDFRCPLSQGLMYDPVVIASGQTFERVWIQKWFDEGNDMCPKTNVKLDHLMLTPNTTMKDLMSKWCLKHEVKIQDPSRLLEASTLDFSTASVASFTSSIYNLSLPSDISSVSIGASDSSSCFKSSGAKLSKESSFTPMERIDDFDSSHADPNDEESDSELLPELAGLPWELQRKVVEDVRTRLKQNHRASQSMSAETVVEPLFKFLKNAHDFLDVESTRAGSELLLTFLTKSRRVIESLSEDAFSLLPQLLDSEATIEALSIIEVLSAHPHGRSKIISSGALSSILKILDNRISGLQEQAVITLRNLSSSTDICSDMVSQRCVPKLTPFLNNNILSRHCVVIFRHLCDTETGRVSLAETNGCISSLSELLEIGTAEEKENAVYILLSLCSQRVQYCQLVMNEGVNVIPSLVDISFNGNNTAKAMALELLRNLRPVDYGDEQETIVQHPDVSGDVVGVSSENTPTSKPSRFLGLKFPFLGPKKKR